MKQIMTLNDLYEMFSSHDESIQFSSKDEESEIKVAINGQMKFEETDDSGLMPVELYACHVGVNRNKSNIEKEVMEKAIPSFYNKPILGYIHEVDGQDEFYTHNMHADEDGNIIYDESPVGVIPESCDAHFVKDEELGNEFLAVNGYIYRDYSKAAEILMRKQMCQVSVEISVKDLTFDVKNKILNINDFVFSGVTILGKTPEGKVVDAGMSGSNIKPKVSKEGGNEMFENLLKKYNKTVEDIDFEYENLTDEELEAKFAEVFEENEDEVESEDYVKTFQVSHDDIRCALYRLLDARSEEDHTWYYIDSVFDGSFIYSSQGVHYGQKYEVMDDVVSFVGDGYKVYAEFLTDSEKTILDEMRSNYAIISDELAKFKSIDSKLDILNSKEYDYIRDTEEFAELSQKDNYFDLTIDEVKQKATDILVKYAKDGALKFASNQVEKHNIVKTKQKTGRYGNMFAK